jgi:hypothetical protein
MITARGLSFWSFPDSLDSCSAIGQSCHSPYGYNFRGTGGFVASPSMDVYSSFDSIGNSWNGRG